MKGPNAKTIMFLWGFFFTPYPDIYKYICYDGVVVVWQLST